MQFWLFRNIEWVNLLQCPALIFHTEQVSYTHPVWACKHLHFQHRSVVDKSTLAIEIRKLFINEKEASNAILNVSFLVYKINISTLRREIFINAKIYRIVHFTRVAISNLWCFVWFIYYISVANRYLIVFSHRDSSEMLLKPNKRLWRTKVRLGLNNPPLWLMRTSTVLTLNWSTWWSMDLVTRSNCIFRGYKNDQ